SGVSLFGANRGPLRDALTRRRARPQESGHLALYPGTGGPPRLLPRGDRVASVDLPGYVPSVTEERKHSLLGVAMRDLSRLRKLSTTVVRHGFGELLLKTPLGRRLYRSEELSRAEEGSVQGSAAVRFTRMLASLGPTFIKLGQILSMR